MSSTSLKSIRVFISSPGDVPDERLIASSVVENLHYKPAFRGKLSLETVAWDRNDAPPMEAIIPPQEAINRGLPLPSQCDVVIVLFWSRMGTPVTIDGLTYQSGTEFEYRDAVTSARETGSPRVIVYRRMQELTLNPDDERFLEKYNQYNLVKKFFESEFTDNSTGLSMGGYNKYFAPDEFRTLLENHLFHIVKNLLEASDQKRSRPHLRQPALWEGSPFPGLRAFRAEDAPIFFGRGQETDRLADAVRQNQFVVVVGASGSGKSSLVRAGLIPRLKRTSGEGGWNSLTLTPDSLGTGNPFDALAAALVNEAHFEDTGLSPKLANKPALLGEVIGEILAAHSASARFLLFVDQFEELFTTIEPVYRQAFINAVLGILASSRIHIVMTVRGDFYGACVETPELTEWLESGTFPLAAPKFGALYEMITRPADRAGLRFEEGLAQHILDDTGDNPGALALMAYALDELYRERTHEGILAFDAYMKLGGVQGAIGRRSETTFAAMTPEQREMLPRVFRELVSVKEDGTVTRRRTPLAAVAQDDDMKAFVAALTKARLLVVNRGQNNHAYVEVAHEALLKSWTRLAQWITDTQEDLRLLQQVRQAAREWEMMGKPEYYLWQHERLVPVYQMRDRLGIVFSDEVAQFTTPEHERLLAEFRELLNAPIRVSLYRQMNIVDRFAEIGEAAIPAIVLSKAYAAGKGVSDAASKLLESFDPDKLMPVLEQLADSSDPTMTMQARQVIEELEQKKLLHRLQKEITEAPHDLQTQRIRENDDLLGGLDPMEWLESLARRQGANKEEFVTAANLDIPEVESSVGIDEPGYRPFNGSTSTRTTQMMGDPAVARRLLEEQAGRETIEDDLGMLLKELEGSTSYRKRYFAAQKLTGKPQATVLLGLIAALRDDNEWVRLSALEALAASKDVRTIPFVLELTEDKHADVRAVAEAVFRSLAKDDLPKQHMKQSPKPVPMRQPNQRIQKSSRAITKQGTLSLRWEERTRLQSHREAIKERERSRSGVARKSLGEQAIHEEIDDKLLGLLQKLENDSDYYERYFAAQKLSGRTQARVLLGLINALQDENEWVRQAAIKALGATKDSRAIPFIKVLTMDNHADVRATAKAILRSLS